MTTTQAHVLVLKDSAGSYFLLPQALLERGRVPEEHTADLEQIVNDGDVSGHFIASYLLYRIVRDATVGKPLYPVIQEVLDQYR